MEEWHTIECAINGQWECDCMSSGIYGMVKEAHKTAKQHGFWDDENEHDYVILGKLMLVATEVAEAAEEVRKQRPDAVLYADTDLGAELADICIRVFDLAGALDINLEKEIVDKMAKNSERKFKHGKRV